MTTDLATFTFAGDAVRVIHIDSRPWWVASDLALVLGYRDAPQMTRMLDDGQKGVHIVSTLGGEQTVTIVNESGMWSCVIKSRRPEAKAFQRLLTDEILPSLRRQGFYAMPGANLRKVASVAEFIRVGNALKSERNRALRASLWLRLDQICDGWNIPRIDHVGIGFDDPDHDQLVKLFWDAVRSTEETGIALNQSRKNHLIALNLSMVEVAFAQQGVPIRIDFNLREALRQSRSPAYTGEKSVNCSDGKSRHCWVFTHAPLLDFEGDRK